MAKVKTPKYLMNETRYKTHHGIVFVRMWKQRRDFNVQVWLSGTPEGEPDGDWEMPGVLGPTTCMEQAILQTDAKK